MVSKRCIVSFPQRPVVIDTWKRRYLYEPALHN